MVTQTDERTELQIKILNVLNKGQDNAIKMRELKAMLGPFNERVIRQAISDLRLQKYLVLSSSRGYWFAESFDEYRQFADFMYSYIGDISHMTRVMGDGASERFGRYYQPPLF